MKLGFSQQEIIGTAKSLGLPTDGFIQRRIARAYDLVESNKVSKIDDGIFRVRSQYEPDKSYIVNVNHGAPYCDCPDGERTINCKHRIASLLYQARQAQAKPLILKETTDDVPNQFIKRSWFVLENGNRCLTVVEELNRLVFCNCGAHYDNDCIHKQAVIKSILDDSKRIANECGSAEAKALQDKLNGQLDSRNGNGNGAQAPPQTMSLDIRDPFQEAEQLDIDQIEGRLNGELVHKLSNGEYVISYRGIMTLAKKHSIEFDEVSLNDNTVIAKAKNGRRPVDQAGNERISGKPIYDNATGGFVPGRRRVNASHARR